jgi:hypothetical protein
MRSILAFPDPCVEMTTRPVAVESERLGNGPIDVAEADTVRTVAVAELGGVDRLAPL